MIKEELLKRIKEKIPYGAVVKFFEGEFIAPAIPAVMGFAYFLVKNRPVFFENGELLIKSNRCGISGTFRTDTKMLKDNTDYTKLASLKLRWNDIRDKA